jgi:hypothetical protein
MTITEKKFNVIDSDLSKFAISPKERFVSEVCRYRNYKSKFVLDKTQSIWSQLFTEITAKFYYREILRYLNENTTVLSLKYKKLIDKYRNINPVPVDREENRRETKKEVVKSSIDAHTTEKFYYGIKFNGCCMITFNSEREQEIFVKGLEMASIIKDYKKIHIRPDAITEV